MRRAALLYNSLNRTQDKYTKAAVLSLWGDKEIGDLHNAGFSPLSPRQKQLAKKRFDNNNHEVYVPHPPHEFSLLQSNLSSFFLYFFLSFFFISGLLCRPLCTRHEPSVS
jgi:hypothetical protein